MSPARILLDTDIGTNVDDAVALWYLLHEPACELLGVTTVTGRPGVRAALARAICAEAGRTDVPVVAGAAQPLKGVQQQIDVPLADAIALRAFVVPGDESRAAAVEFLAETIQRRPGEVTLVAIGPLTNVARLCRERPAAFAKLRAIFAMIGRYDGARPRRDTNTELDPEAARIVLESAGVPLCLVGLDATDAARFSEAALRSILGDVAQGHLGACIAKWFQTRREAVLHDPLTALAAVHPDGESWVHCGATVVADGSSEPCVISSVHGCGPHRAMVPPGVERVRARLRSALQRARA